MKRIKCLKFCVRQDLAPPSKKKLPQTSRVGRRYNQSGKRKAVIIVRERGGNSVPAESRSEGQALSFIRARIANGTTVQAYASPNWMTCTPRPR